jgi:hypothetical protein
MDQDLKAYLDTNFTSVNNRIESLEKNVSERISPIKDDVGRLRTDVADLYDKDRQQVMVCEQHRERTGDRINDLNAWKTAVEAQSGGKKWRTEQILIVVMALVTAAVGLASAML